jgi:hypothetical protein
VYEKNQRVTITELSPALSIARIANVWKSSERRSGSDESGRAALKNRTCSCFVVEIHGIGRPSSGGSTAYT